MSTGYIWEIKVKNTPLLKKKCSHCDSTRFYCSEKFRTNAQKKNIDVWLIYRCVKCSSTYNMTIISRTGTESIGTELYEKLMSNDRKTAWKYAFSQETRMKNNIEADPDSVEYDVECNDCIRDNIISEPHDMITFTIRYPFEFGLRISSVIRTGLGLSSSQFSRLSEMNAISVHGKSLRKKHRIRNGDVIRIDREKLKNIYHNGTSMK